MLNLIELIKKRREDLKNNPVDTTDIDYLNKFNANVKALSDCDFFDIITIFYMIRENVSLEEAIEEINCFRDILEEVLMQEDDPEFVIKIMDMFYEFMDKYKNKFNETTLSEFSAVRGASKILLLVKTLLKTLKLKYSESDINKFLKWMCTDELSDIIALAANLKGVKEQLNLVYDELDDLIDINVVKEQLNLSDKEAESLDLYNILPTREIKKLQNNFVNGVNNSYLKDMDREFKKELDELSTYKSKKQSEINSLKKKLNRELRDLDLLEQDFLNGRLSLEKIEKYKLRDDIRYLAMIELIKQRNIKFNETYKRVEGYRKNPTNQLEVMFDKFGRNFNKLTDDEQKLLANGYSLDFIKENLNFITTSSLKFLDENDEAFVNILTQEIDDLMQLDSLYVRSKISKGFILSYGKNFNSLTIKMLIHNVSKLDAQKINFSVIDDYNRELLLNLNAKLFDLIVKYGINLNDENLKHFEFLENTKLINIIDKYIELGLLNQIQSSPNLIMNSSEVILKRIVLLEQLGEDYLTDKMTLNQKARSGKDFYLGDSLLDEYVSFNYQTFMDDEVLDILNSNENIELLDSLPEEIDFIENYKKSDQVYMIGGLYFSRLKVLRSLKTLIDYGLTDYKYLLFQALIYNYPKDLSFEIIECLKNIDENIQRKQLK